MNLQDQLIRDEGLRLKPYTDTVGKITIGVGRNLSDDGISHREALNLLSDDMDAVHTNVMMKWPWVASLSNARQGVVLNMAFNMGVEGLSQFVHFLENLQNGNWNGAADQMKNSLWANQVGDRASRLEQQLITDQWV